MTEPEAPQGHIPSPQAVATAYGEVLEHNKRHAGFRAGFGNLFRAVIEAEVANPDTAAEDIYAAANEKAGESTIEGDMQGELQGILHDDTFMRIGVRLAPLGSQLVGNTSERASSTELMPMIENTQLFVDFLGQHEPEALQKDANNLALVNDVITTLQRTIATCYGEMPDDLPEDQLQATRQYGEDALRTFLQIDEAYKRLGLSNPVLEDYVTYWGRGVLPEYLAIGPMEDLATDKLPYFDGMHDKLVAKTDNIVALIQMDHAHDFGVEAAQAMLAGIEKTEKAMEAKPDDLFVSDHNKALLADLKAKLQAAINPQADNQA